MTEIEVEKKKLLSKKQYEQILMDCFSDSKIKQTVQINYYYDTPDKRFYCSGETLRVRQIDNALKLQLKCGKKKTQSTVISKEFHKDINFLPTTISINQTKTSYIGALTTVRMKKECESYTLFLDKNYYLGKVDYELEIEANDYSQMPQEICGIQFDGNVLGKYSRFIIELNKQTRATVFLQCDEIL